MAVEFDFPARTGYDLADSACLHTIRPIRPEYQALIHDLD